MKTIDYSTYSKEQLEKELGTSLTSGLSKSQVDEYQKKYGLNDIEEHPYSWVSLLFRQFNTPFMYLLVGAATVSFFLADRINAIIIFCIVIINGLLSFFQEYRAEQALKLLKAHLTMQARVIREGIPSTIDSKDLVPGDIIQLSPGDYIPADVRIVEGALTVDESLLTGESAPVKKSSNQLVQAAGDVYGATNIGFLATTVSSGSAKAVVLTTGQRTMFGGISLLTLKTVAHSGFQERLTRLSTFILCLTIITLIVLFSFHLLLKGMQTDIIQLLLFSISITLGLTPEALPTVTTFALSRGALQLAHHNVVVKRLSAIEDLGAITILCTDKTGTLTENKLTLNALLKRDDRLELYALLASKKEPPLDPFDAATRAYMNEDVKTEEQSYTRISEIPFDPVRKRTTVIVEKEHSRYMITRGAFEEITKLCLAIEDEKSLKDWIEKEEHDSNRVLALAYKKLENSPEEEQGMTFAGLVAFVDPIKGTAAEAVSKAHKLGITLKMITGDSKEVGCAVAKKIGLMKEHQGSITGAEFAKLSPEEKHHVAHSYAVFARILPEQKFEIVMLLKDGNVVGFLGEGINDAPALKAADAGLAVQGASDTARDAADIILLRKSLLVIVEGIALGRNVFSNTIKYITAAISANFGNYYSVAIASLLIDFLPMLPIQILLVNIIGDLPMVSIATDNVDPEELKKPHEYALKDIALMAMILGIVSTMFDFVFFSIFFRSQPAVLQTNWFIESVFTQLALIYSVRTKNAFFKASRPSAALLLLSFSMAALTVIATSMQWGHTLFHFQAPGLKNLLIIAAITISYFLTTDVIKLLYLRLTNSSKS